MRAGESGGDEEGRAVCLAALLGGAQALIGFSGDAAVGVGVVGDIG